MAWSRSFKWDPGFPTSQLSSPTLVFFSILTYIGIWRSQVRLAQYSMLLSGSKTKIEVTQGHMSYLANLQSIFMCHSSIRLIIIKHLIFWSFSFSNISSRANYRFGEPLKKGYLVVCILMSGTKPVCCTAKWNKAIHLTQFSLPLWQQNGEFTWHCHLSKSDKIKTTTQIEILEKQPFWPHFSRKC